MTVTDKHMPNIHINPFKPLDWKMIIKLH